MGTATPWPPSATLATIRHMNKGMANAVRARRCKDTPEAFALEYARKRYRWQCQEQNRLLELGNVVSRRNEVVNSIVRAHLPPPPSPQAMLKPLEGKAWRTGARRRTADGQKISNLVVLASGRGPE